MKVLFLDLDGVMNRCGEYAFSVPETVLLLSRIVRCTDCRIVLNSSYRTEFDRLMQPLTARAERFCTELAEAGICLHDRTPSVIPHETVLKYTGASGKAVSVLAYLDSHPEVTRYAVLDDGTVRGYGVEARHVRTDGWLGLTDAEAEMTEILLNE